MPLPKKNEQWPPKSTDEVYSKMQEWAAWYSGEPQRIIDVYAGQSAVSGGTIPWWRFWRRAVAQRDGAQRALLHVPVTSDLASVSAALLFGEPPRFRIKEAHEDEQDLKTPPQMPDPAQADPAAIPQPGQPPAQQEVPPFGDPTAVDPMKGGMEQAAPKKVAMTPAEKTERRLLEILERGSVRSRLVEAAETAAAMGGVYIYPAWDKDFFDFPIVVIAQADMAVPEWQWGYLRRVTFHRVIDVIDGKVWRHVETHEVEGTGESRRAKVFNGLFVGTTGNLGEQFQLTAHDDTKNLEPEVELPFGELDVQYVPNIKPNRLWRSTGHGVSDISGSETLLDAIDEVFASWMRDVRLAKARIIVPRDYLRNDMDDRHSPSFDVDQEVYTSMEMEPAMNADARAILAHQFAIRYLEHRSTAREMIERVVSNAGYSPATIGSATDAAGVARTGAALRVSEHKTVLTQRRKAAYWKASLEMLCRHLLLIDKEEFGGDVLLDEKELWPKVEMADSVIDQPLELAQTALALMTAEAASTETRVRIVHPDWSDSEVASEVARIQDEAKQTAALTAKPAPGSGSFGDPEKDPSSGAASFPITSQKKGVQTSKPPPAPPFAKKA